jgi:hypothetical protein
MPERRLDRADNKIFLCTGLAIMPGPLPKPETIRQRRNKSASRALLMRGEVSRQRAPKLPDREDGEWHPMARQFWRTIWGSPMHYEFLRGDEPALLRLVDLVHQYWTTHKLDVAREIRMLEREFGLTPLSRRRLEWSVAQAEEAKDRHEMKRSRRATIIDGDPREVLE